MRTLLLTRRDVAELLPLRDCMEAVEASFRALGEGRAAAPATVTVHAGEGAFHIKAGILDLERSYFAAKSNGNFPANPARSGLATIQGVIVLCDAEDGRVLAVMDSVEVTVLRTAAATAVAARHLARPESSVATICGCGVQGRAQLRALAAVLPLRRALAIDRDAAKAAGFARELSSELGIDIRAASDLSAAVAESDVCVTCTTSREFILGEGDGHDGLFIAAVGVDNPTKREIGPALTKSARVVCDLTAQCAAIGDLHHAIAAGAMDAAEVHAELGAIVAGRVRGRTSDAEVTLFDSTGLAVQDVAAAARVYERARERRSVRSIDWSG